jgi:hypothetical protein
MLSIAFRFIPYFCHYKLQWKNKSIINQSLNIKWQRE